MAWYVTNSEYRRASPKWHWRAFLGMPSLSFAVEESASCAPRESPAMGHDADGFQQRQNGAELQAREIDSLVFLDER